MVLEARRLSDALRSGHSPYLSFSSDEITVKTLDSFGYDQAAQEVYGCSYPDWKKNHQTKATEEQLRLYKASTPIHAPHDEDMLKTKTTDTDFLTVLPNDVLIRLQSGAFRSLCEHLQKRSDEVQNIDLMGLSGFCRNCLAKWLVIQARIISEEVKRSDLSSCFYDQIYSVVKILDGYDYDEAARVVYGCGYPEWKQRYQKKATDEQMERFNASKDFHAKHSKELLTPRLVSSPHKADVLSGGLKEHTACMQSRTSKQNSLLSNVCCEDIDNISRSSNATKQNIDIQPPSGNIELKIAILTVSDRAAANAYDSGDLSGPAVNAAIVDRIDELNITHGDKKVTLSHVENTIVPDEFDEIKRVLLEWSGKLQNSSASYDIIFTTGGTGFAKRDVTPEATRSILDKECHGLMVWAGIELTSKQPLATLSRATSGICGKSIIINLPGSPLGAAQVVNLLFPLLLHAVRDVNDVN